METLHEAAKKGDVQGARLLLQNNKKALNEIDEDGRTPLFWSISEGHIEVSSILIMFVEDREEYFDIQDSAGWTVLHVAASVGCLATLRELLNGVRDVDVKTRMGQTALHFATSKKHLEVARLLLEHGASAGRKDSLQQAPLHRAASIGSLPMVDLLLKYKAPINATDSSGWTPLHHAMAEGNGEVAVELIKRGADPTKLTKDDETAFDVAADEKVKAYVRGK